MDISVSRLISTHKNYQSIYGTIIYILYKTGEKDGNYVYFWS